MARDTGRGNPECDVRDLIKSNLALLTVSIASFILMGAGTALYGPALPVFARSFDIQIGTAGLLISAHWIGCSIGVAAMFVVGARATPQWVVALMTLGVGLMALGLGWPLTLLGAVLFGAGYGCATVVFNPRMLRAFGARGPAMLSLLNATFGIGAIGAPLVFVALGNDPVLSFAICAVIGVVITACAGPAGREASVTATASTMPFRLNLPMLVFGAVAISVEACLTGLGPTALIKAGLSETAAAQLLSAFFLAFLAARLCLMVVATWLPAFTLFTLALLGACASALIAALWSPGVGFVGLGFFAGMFFPTEYVTATRKMGDNPKVAPTIIGAGLVGGVFAPLIMSPFLGAMGPHGFFWVTACVTGALALAALANLRAMNS
ncbi:MFS transporter [Cypionkella sinensis]|uniref:MFS transporter n=1 Tax=Cypionkella sinensis TaxID=1756043 RepID=A0ABV7J1V9_9RHOB